jgi:hypothetical protein
MKSNRTIILNAMLIVILFVSCSSPNDSSPKDSIPKDSLPIDSLPKDSTPKETVSPEQAKIIGTPFRIGSLEVAQYDFPEEIDWHEAMKVCTALGTGWRLPTIEELRIILKTHDKISTCSGLVYWSSSEKDNSNAFFFNICGESTSYFNKQTINYVRAVRSF